MRRAHAVEVLFWLHRRERWHRYQIRLGKILRNHEMRPFTEERPKWLCL